jgi:uncharacterized membrane protein
MYAYTKDSFFAAGSLWMLGAALVMGSIAAVAGLVELLSFKHIFEKPAAHFHAMGNAGAIVLSTINYYKRYTMGPMNFILPGGIFISAMVCGGVIVSGLLGQRLVYRLGFGVTDVTKPRGAFGTNPSRIPPDTFRKEE